MRNFQESASDDDIQMKPNLEMNESNLSLDGGIPLFPLGPPRSGTTIVARILNAHPEILMTNETAVFLMLKDNIKNSRLGAPAGILYGKEHNKLWASHLEQEATRLIEGYYAKIKQVEGKGVIKYWGEKHPHHSTCLDLITKLYPNASYIQIIRDPRDTACSIADMLQVDFQKALVTWKMFADIYDDFFENLEQERFLTVFYEELANDYVGVSKSIINWLGLDYTNEIDHFLTRYSNVDVHYFSSQDVSKKDFAKESIGRWRLETNRADHIFAIDMIGDHLDRYGYPRNTQLMENQKQD